MHRRDRTRGTRLVVSDLRKSYGPTEVLRGVSFALDAGSLTVVTGTNGAGKSTLLRCLAGLASFEGSAALDGAPLPGGPSLRRATGYLPQDVGFPESATVSEILELFSRLREADLPSTNLPAAFLPDHAAAIRTLSGGQRHRVATAVALLGSPALLLLDEPTADLDSWARGAVWEALAAHCDGGSTIIVASPRLDEVAPVCDRILPLEEGRVAEVEPGLAVVAGGGVR